MLSEVVVDFWWLAVERGTPQKFLVTIIFSFFPSLYLKSFSMEQIVWMGELR